MTLFCHHIAKTDLYYLVLVNHLFKRIRRYLEGGSVAIGMPDIEA